MATYTQIRSWPLLLMIVSTQIEVLPVCRSPMISSRCPRPTFVIESIGLMPVSIGSFTGWRDTTPGALNSAGRVLVVFTSPLPSSGRPSGSTMRPSSSSPTGISSSALVRLTVSPSSILSHSPKRTVPTSDRSPPPSSSSPSIRLLRMLVISSGLICMWCEAFLEALLSRPGDGLSQLLEPVAHARVEHHVAHLQHDAAQHIRVDAARQLDVPARLLLDFLSKAVDELAVEVDG